VQIITPATDFIVMEEQVEATQENIAGLLSCTENVCCIICEDVLVEALGHDYIVHEAQAATCLEIGWDTYNTCSRCDYNDYVEIPAMGHSYTNYIFNNDQTCVVDATKTAYCNHNCGETDTVVLENTALGHVFAKGVCDRCHDLQTKGLKYVLNSDNASYTVKGIGTCTDTVIYIPYQYNNLPVVSIGDKAFRDCNSLVRVELPDSITSIGDSSFNNCQSLTHIVIPDSVMSIGSAVFSGCDNLTYTIENNLKYLGNNKNPYLYLAGTTLNTITTATVQNGCRFIGYQAFYQHSSLTQISLPSTVKVVAEQAFYYCRALQSIGLQMSVTEIGNSAFKACDSLQRIYMSELVTNIGNEAFTWCENLKTVYYYGSIGSWCNITFGDDYSNPLFYADLWYVNDSLVYTKLIIPNTVTEIKAYAFYGFNSFTNVIIGNSVKRIGDSAFQGTNITSVNIPDSVTSIGDYVFAGCWYVTSVIIGSSVQNIGDGVFSGCERLTGVTVNADNTAYQAINGNLYSKDGTILLQYMKGKTETSFKIPDGVTSIRPDAFRLADLTSVEIPNSVTTIGEYAFGNCKLTSIKIPNSVTLIGNGAFSYCSRLQHVEIGNGLTSISQSMFYYCISLTSVVIPDSVTLIDMFAFDDCVSLTNVVIGTSVKLIMSFAFNNCEDLTSVTFKDTTTWYRMRATTDWENPVGGTQVNVTNTSNNAAYLTDESYNWYKL